MKTIAGIIFLVLIFCNESFAQSPIFLNPNQSLVALNPSFAGSNGFVRNQLSFRSFAYGSTALNNSADIFLRPLQGGLALSYTRGDLLGGFIQMNTGNFVYAQHLSFMEENLKVVPSVQVTYGYSSSNWWGPAIQPLPQVSTGAYYDSGAGLLVNYKKDLYLGASVLHLNEPMVFEDRGGWPFSYVLHRTFQFHGAYTFHLSDRTLLQAFARHVVQREYRLTQLSANMIIREHLIAGAGYLSGDVAQVNAGYRANLFSIVLGYDLSFSKLAGNTSGSWELHASFNLRNKENRRSLTGFERF